MKKKFHLIAVFAIAILASFIPEKYPEFFGDYVCTQRHNNGFDHTNQVLHWGYRHWMWLAMGIMLFVWSLVDIFDEKK